MILKNCNKKILICLIVLLVTTNSQPPRPQGRNPSSNPPPSNREDNMRRNQNNRKPREEGPPIRPQEENRPEKRTRPRLERQQPQQYSSNENTETNKLKYLRAQNEQYLSETVPPLIESPQYQDRYQRQKKPYFEEQRHRRGDQKRQSLIKLLFLVVFGLVLIIIILLLKPFFRKNRKISLQDHTTENRTNNNQPQPFIFQTFHNHENDIEKIVIKERETKIQIIKDRFLKRQTQQYQKTITSKAEQPVSSGEENKVDTPTFGVPTFLKQI